MNGPWDLSGKQGGGGVVVTRLTFLSVVGEERSYWKTV